MSSPSLVFIARDSELRRPLAFALRAGPVTLDFVDGDLRHLRAGGEELIRRITFNVRHHRWDTADSHLDSLRLEQTPDSFFLHSHAFCEIEGARYDWTLDITGSTDGTLTLHVSGVAQANITEMRRAGVNILYDNERVIGLPFETTQLDGTIATRRFPELVPAHHLPAMDFSKIAHRTRGGALVTAEIVGSRFGLEDQRVAGDNSFKAFSGLNHTYTPVLMKGERAEKTLTIGVSDLERDVAPAVVIPPRDFVASRLPQLSLARAQDAYGVFHELTRRPAAKNGIFLDVNLAKEKSHGAHSLTWGWYPTINLYDDEMIMDNAASIRGQLLSARHFAPTARLRVDPIALDSIHPRSVPRDPRNDTPFAAAWIVAATRHLAHGGADEAAFALDGPFARATLNALAPDAGRPVRDAIITSDDDSSVAAFAVETDSAIVVWLANLTAETRNVAVHALPSVSGLRLQRLRAETGPAFREYPGGFTDAEGSATLRLAPHEVCAIHNGTP